MNNEGLSKGITQCDNTCAVEDEGLQTLNETNADGIPWSQTENILVTTNSNANNTWNLSQLTNGIASYTPWSVATQDDPQLTLNGNDLFASNHENKCVNDGTVQEQTLLPTQLDGSCPASEGQAATLFEVSEPMINWNLVEGTSPETLLDTGGSKAEIESSKPKNSPSINEQVIINLQTLLDNNPIGFWCSSLGDKYKEAYGTPLKFRDLGYTCAVQMVSHLPELFRLLRPDNSDWFLMDARKPLPKEYEIFDISNPDYKQMENQEPKILPAVLKNIEWLLKNFPMGLTSDELVASYQESFLMRFDPLEMGFDTMDNFLLALEAEGTASLGYEGFNLLVLPHSFVPTNSSAAALPRVSPVSIRIEEDPLEEMMRTVYPLDVLGSKQNVPQVKLPANTIQGSVLEVLVTEVVSPHYFWVILRGKENSIALNDMMTDLQGYYYLHGDMFIMPEPAVRIGQECCCKYEAEWHRGRITEIISLTDVKVLFYDYGTKSKIKKCDLRFLHFKFSNLPTQAILSRLANVKPPNGSTLWDVKAGQRFWNLVSNNKPLVAEVSIIDAQKTYLILSLVDTTGKDDIHINDLLVREGHAVFTWQLEMEMEMEMENTAKESRDDKQQSKRVESTTVPAVQQAVSAPKPPPGFKVPLQTPHLPLSGESSADLIYTSVMSATSLASFNHLSCETAPCQNVTIPPSAPVCSSHSTASFHHDVPLTANYTNTSVSYMNTFLGVFPQANTPSMNACSLQQLLLQHEQKAALLLHLALTNPSMAESALTAYAQLDMGLTAINPLLNPMGNLQTAPMMQCPLSSSESSPGQLPHPETTRFPSPINTESAAHYSPHGFPAARDPLQSNNSCSTSSESPQSFSRTFPAAATQWPVAPSASAFHGDGPESCNLQNNGRLFNSAPPIRSQMCADPRASATSPSSCEINLATNPFRNWQEISSHINMNSPRIDREHNFSLWSAQQFEATVAVDELHYDSVWNLINSSTLLVSTEDEDEAEEVFRSDDENQEEDEEQEEGQQNELRREETIQEPHWVKQIKIAGQVICLLNVDGQPYLCTDELVRVYTKFSSRHVVLKILEVHGKDMEFIEINRRDQEQIFTSLDCTNTEFLQRTPSGYVVSRLHLTPLAVAPRMLTLLNICNAHIHQALHDEIVKFNPQDIYWVGSVRYTL